MSLFNVPMHFTFIVADGVRTPGVMCNIGYPSETHFKLKSREISFVHNIHFNCPIGEIFAHSTAVLLPCSVQNSKAISQLKHDLRANEISRDLSSRWILDGYSILHKAPAHRGSRWLLLCVPDITYLHSYLSIDFYNYMSIFFIGIIGFYQRCYY